MDKRNQKVNTNGRKMLPYEHLIQPELIKLIKSVEEVKPYKDYRGFPIRYNIEWDLPNDDLCYCDKCGHISPVISDFCPVCGEDNREYNKTMKAYLREFYSVNKEGEHTLAYQKIFGN